MGAAAGDADFDDWSFADRAGLALFTEDLGKFF